MCGTPYSSAGWYLSCLPTTRDFATRLLEKQYNAAESWSVTLSVAEVTVEASVENWWININLFGLAAGGAALHWF